MPGKERNEMKVIPGGNQMSLIRDTEEVIKFLEFAGRKSILNEHAINCRLTACNNLFSVQDEDNLEYLLKNLDVLTNRFRNRNTNVQPSTLKVYKSRVKSSLEDFRAWSADPFAWERTVTDKARAAGLESRKDRKKKAVAAPAKPAPEIAAPPAEAATPAATGATAAPVAPAADPIGAPSPRSGRRVSFPIRADFSVEVILPAEGITLKELHRLGLFLYPYCKDIDPEQSAWPR
jgi:hypothetical protein